MITRIRKMNSDFQTLIASRYPNEFKKKVILYAEKHNNSEAERVFGIAESNIRRWRKLKSIIFSKGFVSENVRRKRLIKKVAQNNDDFIYEIEKLDNMLTGSKKPVVKDYTRVSRSESSPKMKSLISPPLLSPSIPPPVQDRNNSTDPEADEVCLRWNSHHSNMKSSFPSLLQREQYVDVTLTSEGKSLKCHRLILSSCSAYFDELLSGISPMQHPVIFLNGVSFWILKCLIDFMYAGEVHIEQNKLESLLKVAEMLQIKGLTGKSTHTEEERPPRIVPVKVEKPAQEEKSPVLKKEPPSSTATRSPVKKLLSPALMSPMDPLSLLEPTFFEENPVPLKFQSAKKVIPKKIKKRKLSEHEPVFQSPPPILFRKGTKSRPHVKVPRYYHNDYEDLDGKKLSSKRDEPTTSSSSSSTDTSDTGKIKLERVDIEEVDVHGGDKRKVTKDNVDKGKMKKSPEKRAEENDDAKSRENSESTNDSSELIEKEIKLEKIDEDYIDVGDSQDDDLAV